MKYLNMLVAVVLMGVMGSGCMHFTNKKISREREIFKIEMRQQGKEMTTYAGVDAFGFVEAAKADPAGMFGSVSLDAVLNAVLGGIVYLVGDQVNGDGGGGSKPKPKQTEQTEGRPPVVIRGDDNTFETWYDVGPITVQGSDNQVILNNSGE